MQPRHSLSSPQLDAGNPSSRRDVVNFTENHTYFLEQEFQVDPSWTSVGEKKQTNRWFLFISGSGCVCANKYNQNNNYILKEAES